MKKLLIFFIFTIYSYSLDCGCNLDTHYYKDATTYSSFGLYELYDTSNALNPATTYFCSADDQARQIYELVSNEPTNISNKNTYEKRVYYNLCTIQPSCDSNSTFDHELEICVSNVPECTYPEVLDDTNTSCIIPDSDNDGVPDHEDTDDDNDGYSDYQEFQDGTDPLDSNSNSGAGGDGGGVDNGYCPAGQINYGTLQDLDCRCEGGLKGTLVNGVLVCPNTDCDLSIVSSGYTLTLRQQNETATTCYGSYPTSLYNVSFVSDTYKTCCYATARSDLNPTGTECPEGFHKNETGTCVEDDLPPLELPTCTDGQTWNNLLQKCEDNIANTEDGAGGEGGGSSSGEDYNSSSTGGTDTPYDGGDNSPDPSTDNVVLEYNNDEVNDMLQDYSDSLNNKLSDFLSSQATDILTFYTINIPITPSCGCENISYDLTLAGNNFSDTIDVCTPLTSILDTMRPLLWFVFLIGLLFTFFRGDN